MLVEQRESLEDRGRGSKHSLQRRSRHNRYLQSFILGELHELLNSKPPTLPKS